ncbi:unnamed protein product [Timema podura]|uniref:Uncharacterized protein n=1 Tax=Timema podura TaxID=61482 RepID=A0ABN7NX00_TIMPD|nr:unnamed protein product [Timema podura]
MLCGGIQPVVRVPSGDITSTIIANPLESYNAAPNGVTTLRLKATVIGCGTLYFPSLFQHKFHYHSNYENIARGYEAFVMNGNIFIQWLNGLTMDSHIHQNTSAEQKRGHVMSSNPITKMSASSARAALVKFNLSLLEILVTGEPINYRNQPSQISAHRMRSVANSKQTASLAVTHDSKVEVDWNRAKPVVHLSSRAGSRRERELAHLLSSRFLPFVALEFLVYVARALELQVIDS